MKALGISFGKVNANTDILVKEALFGIKEANPDAEIEFVNTVRLKIDRCIGCGACSRSLEKGGDNDCIIKDDLQPLEEKIRDADCIILGSPVYVLQPVGQFKNLVDRFSCRHDTSAVSWVYEKRKKGELPGDPEMPDPRRFKQRYIGYISVGGATTENWVSMGTSTLHLFGFPNMMKVVGSLNVHKMGTTGHPLLDSELMERVHGLGVAVGNAYGKPLDEIPWYGEEGVCPVCHQKLITLNGTTTVECPVCDIEGHLSVEGDKVKVEFSKEQQQRARGTFAGLREHTVEIQGFGAICAPKIMANKEMIDEGMKKYKNFDEYINK